jgi:hypothetical protein
LWHHLAVQAAVAHGLSLLDLGMVTRVQHSRGILAAQLYHMQHLAVVAPELQAMVQMVIQVLVQAVAQVV